VKITDRIRELLEKATPAPWTTNGLQGVPPDHWGAHPNGIFNADQTERLCSVRDEIHIGGIHVGGRAVSAEQTGKNFKLIAELRNRTTDLLDALDAARAELRFFRTREGEYQIGTGPSVPVSLTFATDAAMEKLK